MARKRDNLVLPGTSAQNLIVATGKQILLEMVTLSSHKGCHLVEVLDLNFWSSSGYVRRPYDTVC